MKSILEILVKKENFKLAAFKKVDELWYNKYLDAAELQPTI